MAKITSKLLTLDDIENRDENWIEDIEVGNATLSRYEHGKESSVWFCTACEVEAPDARELGCCNESCECSYES